MAAGFVVRYPEEGRRRGLDPVAGKTDKECYVLLRLEVRIPFRELLRQRLGRGSRAGLFRTFHG